MLINITNVHSEGSIYCNLLIGAFLAMQWLLFWNLAIYFSPSFPIFVIPNTSPITPSHFQRARKLATIGVHICEFFQNKIQIEQSNVHSKGSTYCNPPHRIRRCIPCDGCISEIRLCTFPRWHIWIGRGRRKYPDNPQPRPICRDSQSTRRTSFPWARRGRCRIYDPPFDRCDNLKKKHSFVYNPFPLAKVQFQNTVYCRRLTSFIGKYCARRVRYLDLRVNFIFKIQLSVGTSFKSKFSREFFVKSQRSLLHFWSSFWQLR